MRRKRKGRYSHPRPLVNPPPPRARVCAHGNLSSLLFSFLPLSFLSASVVLSSPPPLSPSQKGPLPYPITNPVSRVYTCWAETYPDARSWMAEQFAELLTPKANYPDVYFYVGYSNGKNLSPFLFD